MNEPHAERMRVLHIARRADRHKTEDVPADVRAASVAARMAAANSGPLGIAVAVIDALHAAGGVARSAERTEARIRNRAIRRQFNGRNHRELADRYGISVRSVRRILSHSQRNQEQRK